VEKKQKIYGVNLKTGPLGDKGEKRLLSKLSQQHCLFSLVLRPLPDRPSTTQGKAMDEKLKKDIISY
jgi:hypothetical protein